jgi:hypothetical protein
MASRQHYFLLNARLASELQPSVLEPLVCTIMVRPEPEALFCASYSAWFSVPRRWVLPASSP